MTTNPVGPGGIGARTTVRATYQPIMGTFLDLHVTAPTEERARAGVDAAAAEARRLVGRLSAFEPASDLSRWRAGEIDDPGPALGPVLALACAWQARSGGALHPATAVLTARWQRAEVAGVAPSAAEMAGLAASIASISTVEDLTALDPSGRAAVDVQALAKGWVVDRAADAAAAASPEVERVLANAGGDLVHRGTAPARVGVEDPNAPYDNRPPLLRIELDDRAVATSGRSRRWFHIAGRRFSRVIDPRTGWPVEHTASATVVAEDTATADALATIASVLSVDDAVALVDATPGAACFVVEPGGAQHRSSRWAELEA